MELKDYQQRVIDNLDDYLAQLVVNASPAKAFKAYWHAKGVTGMDAYKNNVPGIPHVCAKVLTAGGKTFIAVNAIKAIFDALAVHNPDRSKLVVWLVPSLSILEQTVRNLDDADHPYRRRLNQLFSNRVAVFEKRDLLMGAGFSADTVSEQLSIVVMSFGSLKAKNKEDRKIFQDNAYLASFAVNDANKNESLLPGYDATALINVIRGLQPIVIVDESHNAETELSVEMLVNLNPHFIFDLTATPRNNSNIISYVDAMALKKQHMVKLPVIVSNQSSRNEAIESAIILRKRLEDIAIKEEAGGGKYIRPIVLFQAQPRTGEDNTTFEKTKEQLITSGIPEDQIKIKTADINELKGIDLMSRDCTVRYIITVNALKEGWDCPFAYILASLADKSSAVDVEQILGRILRMPHVQQHGHELLNTSYVFTASALFSATLQNIVKGLNRAGFSDKDYRVAAQQVLEDNHSPETDDLFVTQTNYSEGNTSIDLSNKIHENNSINNPTINGVGDIAINPEVINAIVKDENDTSHDKRSPSEVTVDELTQQAIIANKTYEEKASEASSVDIPAELEDKMNRHKIKGNFREDALALKIPQFFIHVEPKGWIEDETTQLFEKDFLLKEFNLGKADATISFEDVETELYKVDLEYVDEGEYKVTPFKAKPAERKKYNLIILRGDRDNSDSELKLKLGKLWESKVGPEFKYMMVFDNNPVSGAERLADAIKKLGQM